MENYEIEIPKENILKKLSISDVIKHFGLKEIIKEMDVSEVVEAVGYMECLRIADIDYVIEYLENEGFIINENPQPK